MSRLYKIFICVAYAHTFLWMLFLIGCGAERPTPDDHSSTADIPTDETNIADGRFVCPDGPFAPLTEGEMVAEAVADIDMGDTGHLFEGAVWLDGALYFSHFTFGDGFPSEILKYHLENGLEVVIEDSGSNGLCLDPKGAKLLAAMHKTHSISAYDLKTGVATPIADTYKGLAFNSPNDLAARSDGNIYFTDPDFQSVTPRPQDKTRVYRIDPDKGVSVVDDTIENPNGVTLSPDESILYVAGNQEAGFVKRYDIAEDGRVGTGERFIDGITVPDGMAVDCAGNIYVAEHTKKQIRIFSPNGEFLGRIGGLERNVTNAAFGGPERKTLYITTLGRLYRIEMPIPGLPY